jgi:hypothetical protein
MTPKGDITAGQRAESIEEILTERDIVQDRDGVLSLLVRGSRTDAGVAKAELEMCNWQGASAAGT